MLTVGMYGKGLVGTTGCNDADYRSQFALWCMFSAPLMLGCDIREMNETTRRLVTNPDLIRINQDAEARPPMESRHPWNEKMVTLLKHLDDGSYALGFFNMDEKDGVLRVVTTLRRRAGAISDSGLFRPFLTEPGEVGVALFCVSLSDWTVAGKLMRFAPEGEEVKSVRFEGDTAYVCTATTETVVLDPVFFLDLSDPKAITVKESGTIPGFSHSLVELGDGLLLGIGRDEKASCFKAEVYAEGEEGVRILGSYLLDNSFFATDYKAYYIDRERDLLGLCYQSYGEDGLHSYYLLLQWREDGFAEVARREISSDLHSLPSTTRAFALGQQLCVISEAEAFVLPPV